MVVLTVFCGKHPPTEHPLVTVVLTFVPVTISFFIILVLNFNFKVNKYLRH